MLAPVVHDSQEAALHRDWHMCTQVQTVPYLIRDVKVRWKTSDTTQNHWQDVGVNVFGSVDVNPDYGRDEHKDASVLIAGAQPNKKSANTKRCHIFATDASHCIVF